MKKKVRISESDRAFAARARESFLYLVTDFGCQLIDEAFERYSVSVFFQNRTTAAEVRTDKYESRVFLFLYRLEGGKRVTTRTWRRCSVIYFENVLQFRNPELVSELNRLVAAQPADAAAVATLNWYARYLPEYASDILKGDFTLFGLVEDFIWSQRPPNVTDDE